MKIKISEDMFDNRIYNLTLEGGNIIVSENEKEISEMPVSKLKSVTVEGKGENLKRFTAEIDDKIYEGSFLNNDDAEAMLSYLRAQGNCRIDINLEAFEK